MWVVQLVTLAEAQTLTMWSYPAPYDVCNFDFKPELLLTPEYRYHTVYLENELVGFFCLGEDARVPGGSYNDRMLDLGLGMRPDLTGQGMGAAFLEAILNSIVPTPLRLTVATFNERGKRLYERFGFHVSYGFSGAYGLMYVQMIRLVDGESALVTLSVFA